MTSDELLAFAEQLANRAHEFAQPEAALRSAISRAYYAAFWAARDGLEALPPRGDTHSWVIEQYAHHPSSRRQCRAVAESLKRARRARNEADYDATGGEWRKRYELCITEVKRVLTNVSICCGP